MRSVAGKNMSRSFSLHKNPLARMLLPAGMIILLANLFIPNPDPDDSSAVIEKAWACGNHAVLEKEYEKLIQGDFFNVAYHRGYIKSHSRTFKREDAEGKGDSDDAVRKRYDGFAADSDGSISDIGYYGLGYFYLCRDDYERAETYYRKVGNKSLKYLNSSLGYVYLKLKRYELAKRHFYEEIRHGGNLDGAYSNLGRTLLETKEYDELDRLIGTPNARGHVPGGIIQLNHLIQGEYGRYFLRAFDVTDFTYPGLICAFLILLAWFFYLRQLDVFEPEKIGHLLLTLLLGMLFSTLTTPLYDSLWVYLGFRLTGDHLNDLLFCILGIGVIEEALKIAPVLIIMKWTNAINESIDFIIYASVSALGFAFMENLLYFDESGLTSVSGRAFTAVLLHMSVSSFVMYGLFCATYRKERGDGQKEKAGYLYFALSFGIACAIHGIYDFWLVAEGIGLWALMAPLVHICVVDRYGRVINTAINQSEFMPMRPDKLVDASDYLVYALAGIVLLEYVTLALKFGPQNANHVFMIKVIVLFIVLIIIMRRLGSFEIRRRKWIPLFGRKRA